MINGDEIKRIRESKNWTTGDLAEAAGCSQQLISYLEKNSPKTSRSIRAIAGALGVPVSDLDDSVPAGEALLQLAVVEMGMMKTDEAAGYLRNFVGTLQTANNAAGRRKMVGKAIHALVAPRRRRTR